MNDSDIIRRICAGNTEDFGLLVEKYSGRILGLCLSLCGNRTDAEEAAQDAFVDAFLYLSSLQEREKFDRWLYAIARRKSYRQRTVRRLADDIDDFAGFLASDEPLPYEAAVRGETAGRIAAAIGHLSEKQRGAAELFYFYGLKINEIAKKLFLPENTVKSRLFDAREKLRKELADMNEHQTDNSVLEDKIKERIRYLTRYYSRNGALDDRFGREVDETISLINGIDREEKKQQYLADAFNLKMCTDMGEKETQEWKERRDRAAVAGGNATVIADALIDDTLDLPNPRESLAFLNTTALPKIEESRTAADWNEAKGSLLLWRGRFLLALGKREEAIADLRSASELIPPQNAYHALAVAAWRELNDLKGNAYEETKGFAATADGLLTDGTRLLFHNQPGFSEHFSMPGYQNRFRSFLYFASRCRHTLFDTAMKPGEQITDSRNGATLQCVGADEAVTVAAGMFSGCLHMRTGAEHRRIGRYTLDAWYAPAVGLVRVCADCGGEAETYELTGYTVKGGAGYFPFAEGNGWTYIQTDCPEWIYQPIVRRVDYTDGELTNLSVETPFTLAKNFESSRELDSSVYLSLADHLCDDWKLPEAVEMLRKAVRHNVNEKSVRISLFGIEVLNRFVGYREKGYRFCPSSINASRISAAEGVVRFLDPCIASFGPYRLGARGRYEDRIFGIKPFTYLNLFMGKLWDDRWIPGYTEEKEIGEGLKLFFSVTDGGSVTTPAGSFPGCRKLTLRVDKPENADDRWYFADFYRHMHCGIKEYWFAPGVGIVRILSSWGPECEAECLLCSVLVPAAGADEFLPVQIGNAWEYEEPHLAAEGYRAKSLFRIASGMNGEYLMTSSQEFICFRTEEEYQKFVKESHRY